MTPQEKAQQIYSDCEDCLIELDGDEWGKCVKKCALIAVDEMIKELSSTITLYPGDSMLGYWQQVKQEIQNL